MYEYRCKVTRVVDGDTVDVDIDLGFGVWLHKERTQKYDAKGKFGRILGDIIVDNKSLSETMIKEHHAVPYYGQSKEEISESHLKNRAFIKIV